MNTQPIEVYQSLWAMRPQYTVDDPHSLEAALRRIAEGGFTGVCLDCEVNEIAQALTMQPLFDRLGLKCLINAFPRSVSDLEPFLKLAREMQAPFLNVVGCVYPLSVEDAVPIVRAWLEHAQSYDMPLVFETHRDCITNDMLFTLKLLDAVPEMRLCADLSHYVVARELRLPLDEHWRGLFEQLLERAECFHGRVATAQQIQAPLTFPQHRQWVELFRNWWAQGIAMWRARAAEDATLAFVCELGPAPYAPTDARGQELSDRWVEAGQLKRWVESCS